MTSQHKRRLPASDGYDDFIDFGAPGCHSAPKQSAAQDDYQGEPRESYSFPDYHDTAKRVRFRGAREAAVFEETRASSYDNAPSATNKEAAGVHTVKETIARHLGNGANAACSAANGSTERELGNRVPPPVVVPNHESRSKDAAAPSPRSMGHTEPWIPLLITFVDETITAWDLDPKAVDEAIRDFCGSESVIAVKTTATGCFVVNLRNGASVVKLQSMKSLLGAAVQVKLSSWYTRNMAKIRSIPLYVKDEEVMDALVPIGVIAARRAVAYTRLDNGECLETPKNTVILVFGPEVTAMPATVTIDGEEHEVEPCQRVPIQCMNCFGYGHQARRCGSPARCKLCAGLHHHHQCSCLDGYLCVNCGGGHAATFSSCPARERAIADLEACYHK
ncbi:hypothetical protein HPB52_001827 [Rhipicephalus sanguineus]|uniref:Gag-like protein n=1 Tax=Rhipicephalus sanguineus TaxID=34632 RepID=A0A9D4PBX3_RHISA|nr:hypothetical protein HPB52_001827 [Rhipicephalus sanguineus]